MARRDQRLGGRRVALRSMAAVLAWAALLLVPLAPAAGEETAADAYIWRLGLKRGLEARGLSCLRIHPRDDGILWAHVHGLGPARSADGGRTWEPMLRGIDEKFRPGPGSQVRLSLDPRDAKILYLVVDGQILRSEDGGTNWVSITSGALASLRWDKLGSNHLSWEVRVDAKKGSHLLVGTRNDGMHNGGLFESTNSGKSWERIAGTTLPKSKLGNDTLFVRADPKTDKVITVAGRTAVWYSDDRGRSFERNDPGGEGVLDVRDLSDFEARALYLADARGIWRSRDAGKSWDKKPLREGDARFVLVDPHNRKRIYVAWHGRGIEYSEDARHSKWVQVRAASEDPDPGYVTMEGREICVHPRDRKLVYLASPVTGLHVSTDGGESFAPVLPPEDHDPAAAAKVIPAITTPLAFVAAHPQRGGRHLAVSREGVVYRSEDRGETWSRVGRIGQAPTLLQADAAPGTWFAAGRTLLRSQDDGATWGQIFPRADTRGVPGLDARIVSLHRAAAADGKPGALRLVHDRTGVVYTSTDDGATWTAGKAPKAIADSVETWAAALAVDPANEQHLALAARSVQTTWSPQDENGGVFESWDGGATWKDITGNLAPGKKDTADERRAKTGWNRARFLALDASSASILYGADGRGIFMRPWVDPKAKAAGEAPAWIRVNPAGIEAPVITTALHTVTADQTDTRVVLQVRGAEGKAGCFEITGRTLAAAHAHATAEEPEGEAPGWTSLPSPGAGEYLGSLAADPQLPGRLLATDAGGDHGVIVFEIPGSKPAEPKKDEPKKDEPAKGSEGDTAAPAQQPPEGMRAFTAGQDKLVRIWAVDKGTPGTAMTGHENVVRCIAITPDETHILSGADDRTLRLWSAVGGKPAGSIPLDGAPRGIAVDADSAQAYVALGEAATVAQVDLATKAVKTFAGHKGPVTCVAVSEDVQRAYSGGEDKVVLVWDTAKGAEVNAMVVGASVTALAVSADGTRVYAAGDDGSVAAFDAAGKPAGRLEALPAPTTALALAPDGTMLYAATADGVVAIATADMAIVRTHAAPGGGALTCVTTSADGIWILAGDAKGGLWLWDREHAAAFRPRQQGHEGPLLGVCLTREETALAAPPPPPKDDAGKTAPGDAPKEEAPKEAPPVPDDPKKDDAKKDGGPKDAPAEPAPPAEEAGK